MFRSLVCFFVLSLFAFPAFAATVGKVKGKNVLIDLKGDPAAPGDLFYAVKADGKRSAILKIGKVKGDKAIGTILKGNAAPGMSLELKPSKVTASGGGGAHNKRSNADCSPAGRTYWC